MAAPAATLRIDFIDVGQGDASLVTSPTGKTVLIDGGPRKSSQALMTFLRARVRRPLDLIVLTHRHEDHLGGLTAAVNGLGARQFLDAPVPHPGLEYAELMEALEAHRVEARQATHGRKIDLGGGAVMTLVGPPDPAIVGSRSDVNANSVVTRLTYGKFAVLFAGDAEKSTETWLMASAGDLGASVLKVAHHGSRYASGARFLQAVGARIAIVSAGTGNVYGHPAPATLARLARTGARRLSYRRGRRRDDRDRRSLDDGAHLARPSGDAAPAMSRGKPSSSPSPSPSPSRARPGSPSGTSSPSGPEPDGSLLYVDAIEAGHARLLLGKEAFEVPARLLPRGVKEGTWLRARFVRTSAPPEEAEAEARRRRLGQGDDGGDIKL